MPAVSVLVAFHRDTSFLRPAIASVLGQTLHDWELVLVDNGTGLSTDAVGSAAADPRVRWVRLEHNMGIAFAYNAGVAAAQAAYVALLDHDDMMLPHRLERQVAILRARPELGLIGSGATTIDATGQPIGREFCLVEAAEHRTYSAYHSGAIMPSFTGRAAVFRAAPFRPAFRWSGDFDFITRVAERHAIAAAPEVLLHYRRHAGQTTRTHRAAQVVEECYVRLLCARRRRGLDEHFETTIAEMHRRDEPVEERAVHAEFGRRFITEGFFEQAVYQARHLVATGRDMGSVFEASRILAASLRRAPGRAVLLNRLFFQGPVRAHGLRNVGPDLPE